jgi:hypothetical protein
VNLLADNIDAIKKNTETLNDVSKEVGLKPDAGNLSTLFSSQKCSENHSIGITNRSLKMWYS